MLKKEYRHIVLEAFREDAVDEDITTNLIIPKDKSSQGNIIFKEDGILCGIKVAKYVFRLLDRNIVFKEYFKDGEIVKKGDKVLFLKGKTRALLTGERTALNFLSYLSGIATNTKSYVDAVKPFKSKILDTRKTTPGMRRLEKYAVKCGGGTNHRLNLIDFVLIKDNHREALGDKVKCLSEVIKYFRTKTHKMVEIEVDNFTQLRQALRADPDIIMLDNMNLKEIKKAIEITQKAKGENRPILEASGGITLKNIKKIASTGIDHISVGALTHTHKFIDVSMDFIR
ncbi:MAG: carboxylating nicotinate-nucleotide diphosphorylase [Candidatus Omnitrophica bacterium]|nr:carboxylating nicotinate-nucleotide diphosphorylase [Candidatus Omnitrophota bacterium]